MGTVSCCTWSGAGVRSEGRRLLWPLESSCFALGLHGSYAALGELHQIRDNNDWRGFHSPKNLAMAASVEMAELVEIFQWLSEDESRQLPADKLAHAGQEVGDVILYLLLLCSELGLDMEQVVRAKLADSERRFAR
jgi:NTP pyrophosphatase (non-canonical NTP hydrolase)